jgi:hypothetical protein
MKWKLLLCIMTFPFLAAGQIKIKQTEHWFDTGFAQRVVTGTPSVSQFTFNGSVSTNALQNGLHSFNCRFKDSLEQYSSTVSQLFIKTSSGIGQGSRSIIAYEYWFDTAFNSKVLQTVTPNSIFQLSSNILANIAVGLHTFNIRFKDNGNTWSTVHSQFVVKAPNGSSQAGKAITEYEYWFDTLYNNRIQQTVSSASQLQLLANLPADIPTGLHAFHIRFRDNGNVWSSVHSQFIIKTPAGSGSSNKIINAYEYWFDTNFSTRIIKAVSGSNPLIISENISDTSLANGLHTVHLRFRDNSNVWSNVQSQFILKFNAVTNTSANNIITSYRYWFDTSFSKRVQVELANPTNQLYLFQILNLASVDTGKRYFHLQFKDALQRWSSVATDSVIKLGRPRIDSYTPHKGGNAGRVSMNIYGTGFQEGTLVRLTKAGHANVISDDSSFYVFNGTSIRLSFKLTDKDTGYYNLVVEIPNDTIMTIINGFYVEVGTDPAPWADVIGPPAIRVNEWSTYTVVYGNKGNSDALGVPIYLIIGGDTSMQHKINVTYIPFEDSLLNSYLDSIPEYFIVDTVFGKPYVAAVYALYIPVIPANSVSSFSFKIKKANQSNLELFAFASNTLWENPPKQSYIDCQEAVKELALGAFDIPLPVNMPYVSCVVSYQYQELYYKKVLENPSLINVHNYFYYSVGIILNCVGTALISVPYPALGGIGVTLLGAAQFHQWYGLMASTVGLKTACGDIFEDKRNQNKTGQCQIDNGSIDRALKVNIIQSVDPNEKYGFGGSGANKYSLRNTIYPYSIHFENDSAATASAQKVRIVDTLDTTILDKSSFELGFVKVANKIINIPGGLKQYTGYIDYRPEGNDIILKIEAALNDTTGIATWLFTSLDPETMQPTTNVFAGFLPPNRDSTEGQGSVFFTINAKDSLPNNTQIRNKAYIYFDYNLPIVTNEWKNTIDNLSPHSKVDTLPVYTRDSSVLVKWNGIDTSSGIRDYTVYVSENGKPYEVWKLHTSDTTGVFIGKYDSTYSFYCIATDTAGNKEDAPLNFDAITKIINCNTALNPYLDTLGNTSICSGSFVQLVIEGGNFCTWSNSETNDTISIAAEGQYSAIVSDTFGCIVQMDTTQITVLVPAPVVINADKDTLCVGDTAVLNAAGGISYSWLPDMDTGIMVYKAPLLNTVYIVTATDSNGCQAKDTINIVVNSLPIVSITGTDSICLGDTAVLNAVGASVYSWLPDNENTARIKSVPLSSTQYIVKGTSITGCVTNDTFDVFIKQLPVINISGNDTICLKDSTLMLATGGISYSWQPDSDTGSTLKKSPAVNARYTVIGTAANGCVSKDSIYIVVKQLPVIAITGTDSICLKDSTILTATGGTAYIWLPDNENTAVIKKSPSINTSYIVTGTGANGCSVRDTVDIIVKQLPIITISGIDNICLKDSTTLTATGGTSYTWLPDNDNTNTVRKGPLLNTQYIVTGIGTNGCKSYDTIDVIVKQLPAVQVTGIDTVCLKDTTSLSAAGALSYSWLPDNDTGPIVNKSPLVSTTYIVTGLGVNGCYNSDTIDVFVKPLPLIAVTGLDSICLNDSTTLTATGGINYTWLPNNDTGAVIKKSPASSTAYIVTGLSVNGCYNSDTMDVFVKQLPFVTIAGIDTICLNDSTALTATGTFGYIWLPDNDTGSIVKKGPLATTKYIVTGIASDGCMNSDSLNVIVNALPVVSIVGTDTICAGDTVTLIASGAFKYLWSTSDTATTINMAPVNTSQYIVTGTDTNFCTDTDSFDVYVNPLPAAPIIFILPNGILQSSYATGNQWYNDLTLIPGAISQDYTPIASGIYRVSYTDTNGCETYSQLFNFNLNVDAINIDSRISIFPNPTQEAVTIEGNDIHDPVIELSIYNVSGQKIVAYNCIIADRKFKLQVDLSTHAPGYYSFVFKATTIRQILKVIKL